MPWSKERLRAYDKTRDRSGAYEQSKFGTPLRERRGRSVECQVCGRVFYVTPARVRQVAAKGYNIRFCSKGCYGKAKAGEGNPFWGRTHSEETKTRWRENLERPRFKADATNPNVTRFGAEFRGVTGLWNRERLRRGVRACQRCGFDSEPGLLQLHHRDRDRRNNAEDNLEMLCPNCHALDHFSATDGWDGRYTEALQRAWVGRRLND